MDTLALGGALTSHTHCPHPTFRVRPPPMICSALQLLPLKLHDPLVGEDRGRYTAGQGGQGLVVQDPTQLTVALQLVVLEPETLESGQILDDLLGQTGQVVGVEGE